MKIVSIVGARPQFVKAAVVSRALRERAGVAEVLVHTGQHYDDNMSGRFFDELGIARPDYDLGVGSGTHGAQTARMLHGVEEVLVSERPDWVVVYGDTNSTVAGALAAAKLLVPVAHVEAGLRSYNRVMPEEINRVVTDHLSTLLFAPTAAAVANLEREGITGDKVRLVGDVMYDAALLYGARTRSVFLDRLGLARRSYVLATVHRAENTDDPQRLTAIVQALREIARHTTVVLPLHPRTRAALLRLNLLDQLSDRIRIIDPIGYLEMIEAEAGALLIVTDSGGVQKEAFFFGVPCVTLRTETEWVELVELGWNQLCPPLASDRIVRVIEAQLATGPNDASANRQLYGGGTASRQIADILTNSASLKAESLEKTA